MRSEETAARSAQSKADNPITQRLWIGIGGIAAILATVALLDMVQQRASNEPVIDGAQTAEQRPNPELKPIPPLVTEPLVDLGVVPDLPAEDTPVQPGDPEQPVTNQPPPAQR